MGDVAQFHDPEGDRLIRLAERLGGPENLSEGERWRLANTLDRRRRQRGRGRAAGRARPTPWAPSASRTSSPG